MSAGDKTTPSPRVRLGNPPFYGGARCSLAHLLKPRLQGSWDVGDRSWGQVEGRSSDWGCAAEAPQVVGEEGRQQRQAAGVERDQGAGDERDRQRQRLRRAAHGPSEASSCAAASVTPSSPSTRAATESGTLSIPSSTCSSVSGSPAAWSSAYASASLSRGQMPRQAERVCSSAP